MLSCEHGGNRVPAKWKDVLRPAEALLPTHRGFDAGALELARRLARRLDAPLFAATVTRLLVDLNRHERSRAVFSRWTAELSADLRRELVLRWHRPHRAAVHDACAAAIAGGHAVVHVAVHSFTPVLGGVTRNADVGLLYDPSRARERGFVERWRAELSGRAPALRVRMNYPYRGSSDGLTRWLRTCFSDRRYAGVELELNQALLDSPPRWRTATAAIEASLRAALG